MAGQCVESNYCQGAVPIRNRNFNNKPARTRTRAQHLPELREIPHHTDDSGPCKREIVELCWHSRWDHGACARTDFHAKRRDWEADAIVALACP